MTGTWIKPIDTAPAAERAVGDPAPEAVELFSRHGLPLYRFCRSMLGSASDAEDVVQDTFLKLLQHLQANGDRVNLRAWLFAVAANGCRDRARSRRRWRPWTAELDQRPADPVETPPDRRPARAAFAALGSRDRLLLSLRAQGLSYREMAAASGIADASIGRLLARAVARWKRGMASVSKEGSYDLSR